MKKFNRPDTCTTLNTAPRLEPVSKEVGVRIFDVTHDILMGKREPVTQATPPMEIDPLQLL